MKKYKQKTHNSFKKNNDTKALSNLPKKFLIIFIVLVLFDCINVPHKLHETYFIYIDFFLTTFVSNEYTLN